MVTDKEDLISFFKKRMITNNQKIQYDPSLCDNMCDMKCCFNHYISIVPYDIWNIMSSDTIKNNFKIKTTDDLFTNNNIYNFPILFFKINKYGLRECHVNAVKMYNQEYYNCPFLVLDVDEFEFRKINKGTRNTGLFACSLEDKKPIVCNLRPFRNFQIDNFNGFDLVVEK